MLSSTLIAIDACLNRQLNAILHHPAFQKLEASWRGLSYLIDRHRNTENVSIRVLDINWDELSSDVLHAIDFDQSQLFKKIYSNEFDQPGGTPFGILIGDYFVNPRQDEKGGNDIHVISALMGIAAAAFSPCIIGIHPNFFEVKYYWELESLINFSRIFDHPSYAKWKQLRQDADARFLNFTLIRFCLRNPYTSLDDHIEGFFFKEIAYEHNHYLWGNPVYCLAGLIIRSYHQTGWFYEIAGIHQNTTQGGVVEGIIPQYFKEDPSSFFAKPSCETALKSKQEHELNTLGFITLSPCAFSTFCAFYCCQTFYELPPDGLPLYVTLGISRFAHYLKILARQCIGSFMTRDILQNHLQQWILRYTSSTASEIASPLETRHPLRYSKVTVKQRINQPGYFDAFVHLIPYHFTNQFDKNLHLKIHLS